MFRIRIPSGSVFDGPLNPDPDYEKTSKKVKTEHKSFSIYSISIASAWRQTKVFVLPIYYF